LRAWLWPELGWRRLGSYLVKRITRLPGTPHSIAAGFACGTAISFTPFLGFHIALSVLLAFLVRGNYLAAAIGTVVGNPWTFPLIWVATYQLGHFMLGSTPVSAAPEPELTGRLHELGALIWPMAAGSVPLGALAGLAIYFPLVRLVVVYQEARRRRRDHRRSERLGQLRIGDTSAARSTGAP
jgi:uncharacterized protein (DUF2062 family)